MSPLFLDHLVLRVSDLTRAESFYTVLLGTPAYRDDSSLMYQAGDTRLFFTLSTHTTPAPFDKENIGLNHIAFGISTLDELRLIAGHLDRHSLSHSGIIIDHYGGKEFLWLDDPDDMRVEFYLRPQ